MKRQKRRVGAAVALLTLIPVLGYMNNGQSSAAAPNEAPVADLVLNPPQGSAPLTVVADGSGSSDDRQVTSYGFSWGDGTRSAPEPEATASHVYREPGTYTVKITVRDDDNRPATTQRTIEVLAAPPGPDRPPVAEVAARASGPSDVVIDAGESVDDRRITGYQFDFGDGSRTVSQPASTVRHHYKKSGTYEIRVTVTDTSGATDATMTTLAVTATAEPITATKPTVVSFTFDDTLANQIQAADVLRSRGMKGTFYINSPRIGASSYMSRAQVDALKGWHEVTGHTLTHANLPTVTTAEATRQICDDRRALGGTGASFAYPFGATNTAVKGITKNCGYANARGVGNLRSPGYGCLSCPTAETIPAADPYQIRTNKSVQSDTTVEMLKTYVTQAENDRGGWVPLVFHSICSGCATNAMDINSFTAFVDWLSTRPSSTQVKTIASVMGTTEPKPTPSNSVTIGTQTRTLNGTNVARLTDYLVRYTPAYGASTRTNAYGYEAEVIDGKVTKVASGTGNMAIPANGYVLSGHGASRTWLATYAKLGSTVTLNQ